MLAALPRNMYPFLFGGAVSNSAPVQAKLDFCEYLHHVGNDMTLDCFHVVQQGHVDGHGNISGTTASSTTTSFLQ
jgi:Serine carboxypeptidase S28